LRYVTYKNNVDETLGGLRDLCLDAAFDKLLADTEEIIVELDLEALTVPCQRKPPKRYTGDAVPRVAITVSDYYQVFSYLVCLIVYYRSFIGLFDKLLLLLLLLVKDPVFE